ncbi:MAG: YhdH/YhfP family quinone oxidoreductase [Lewinellaceae bacterium]|nr:YhdH/YhfP family quinone oxidoreductase [Phaeodactylibacter sp.]MCB0613320.1 YhdH/YhfP family quinone oxidoreductase [Phaeodactylibacter sp.]MCB9349524.1 YhdH/YhfP family quinone oxidoreductase [Lewinellaceae bacterium]
MKENFKALWVTEQADQSFSQIVTQREISSLPPGEVLIRVHYSSLNYKDALSASGNKGVTRNFPHTPGIDAAGVVAESQSAGFKAGDKVLATGYDLGMNTSGGFAEYIRIPAAWAVPLPEGLSLRESMIYGTAGFTAALSVYQLEKHDILPGSGPIAVTGATGGVGSVAVGILGKAGYEVVAVTGKTEAEGFLRKLGASEVIGREEVDDQSGKAFLKPRFIGAVDTVGGNILATLLKSLHYGGVATCCGLVQSPKLETTVFPFIIKGVSLIGIDSVQCSHSVREVVWGKLANEWKLDQLEELAEECSLEELPGKISLILEGKLKGRTVVRLV